MYRLYDSFLDKLPVSELSSFCPNVDSFVSEYLLLTPYSFKGNSSVVDWSGKLWQAKIKNTKEKCKLISTQNMSLCRTFQSLYIKTILFAGKTSMHIKAVLFNLVCESLLQHRFYLFSIFKYKIHIARSIRWTSKQNSFWIRNLNFCHFLKPYIKSSYLSGRPHLDLTIVGPTTWVCIL